MLTEILPSAKLAILALLRAPDDGGSWDATNVHGVTPIFKTGWFQERLTVPHLTATDYSEDPVGGGLTGIFAVRGGGQGAVQQRVGYVNLNCWAHRDMTGLGGQNPKTIVEAMMRETMRILVTYAAGTDDMEWLSPGAARELPPLTDKEPVVFRAQTVARYGYFLHAQAAS